jgi:hypothetical protein
MRFCQGQLWKKNIEQLREVYRSIKEYIRIWYILLVWLKVWFYMNEVILICNDLLTAIVIQIGTSSLKILCELLDVVTN